MPILKFKPDPNQNSAFEYHQIIPLVLNQMNKDAQTKTVEKTYTTC